MNEKLIINSEGVHLSPENNIDLEFDGTFNASDLGLTSFNNFPQIIKGDLIAINNSFDNFENFPKEIQGAIRIHSHSVNLDDFSFLLDCKFERFYISNPISTVFRDDELPPILHDFKNIFLNRCEVTGDPYLTPEIIKELYCKKVFAQNN